MQRLQVEASEGDSAPSREAIEMPVSGTRPARKIEVDRYGTASRQALIHLLGQVARL